MNYLTINVQIMHTKLSHLRSTFLVKFLKFPLSSSLINYIYYMNIVFEAQLKKKTVLHFHRRNLRLFLSLFEAVVAIPFTQTSDVISCDNRHMCIPGCFLALPSLSIYHFIQHILFYIFVSQFSSYVLFIFHK